MNFPLPVPTPEEKAMEALTLMKNALNSMGSLRQQLTDLRNTGFHYIPHSRTYKVHSLTNLRINLPGYEIPEISFSGHWLQKAGFEPATSVRLITMPQLIVITPEKLPEPVKHRSGTS